jgi:hypothetical protein
MLTEVAAYAVLLATYGVKNSGLFTYTIIKSTAFTFTAIQTRQTTIHDDGGLGAALAA